MYLHLFGETGSGNIWNTGSGNCWKWICIICVIEMSGSMLGSMPEVVQQAEMPSLTIVIISVFSCYLFCYLYLHVI